MSTDPTEAQGGRERRQSQEMSLKRGHPPTQVPGYEPERFLGMGAYGEVWVARERNTGRRVAIKFYAHRGGLDWSLLSHEVEKLAFLFADRYVVQLLGVGWDAEPPYYIMEYLERGSLAERLLQGPLPVAEAVRLFRDVAVGLVHAHNKGVLHCDLKPANILLDQDHKPRLADFGQSRLSHEQIPALGTLFYMAPEQADLEASPDARWDVYALGALLYCMLTGGPPHRSGAVVEEFEQTPHLLQRLARYRELIEGAPPPNTHRQKRGVDRALSEIIDRCLAADPDRRYPNVQSVLEAIDQRAARRAQRPIMVLGAVGPALLLLVVALFAWRGFTAALQQSEDALTRRALESSRFAARLAVKAAVNELDQRYRAVEQVAGDPQLQQAMTQFVSQAAIQDLLLQLAPLPEQTDEKGEPLRDAFREHPQRGPLQAALQAAIPHTMRRPKVAGWFLTDAKGVQVARVPESPKKGEPKFRTIGKCYAWRTYFNGGRNDLPDDRRPREHVEDTTVSAVYRSRATGGWMVAVSHPIFGPGGKDDFIGVAALMVDLGRFVELKDTDDHENGPPGDQFAQFAVLVDWRVGDNQGVVLQHPRFEELLRQGQQLPDDFQEEPYRVLPENLPQYAVDPAKYDADSQSYHDPFYANLAGGTQGEDWLVQSAMVPLDGPQRGCWGVIIQEAHRDVIGSTLQQLRASLIRYGVMALTTIALVIASLWSFVIRTDKRPR